MQYKYKFSYYVEDGTKKYSYKCVKCLYLFTSWEKLNTAPEDEKIVCPFCGGELVEV
jgi:DNA-directed RNA polymerase subunit RPC12/RpoP